MNYVYNITVLAVAEGVMSRSHKIRKIPLDLQYVRKVKQKEQFQMNQLIVRGLPDGMTKDVYVYKIVDHLDMDEDDDFQLEVKESTAVITFAKSYSAKGYTTTTKFVEVLLGGTYTTLFS